MKKHIFCDLDGTLLMDFRFVSEEDMEALQNAQNHGFTISIVTGRLDYEIKMLMDKYGFNGFRISQNGAVIFDNDDKLIYESSLETKDVLSILDALKGQIVIIIFQTIDSYFVEKKVSLVEEFENSQPFIKYLEKPNILRELDKYKFVSISLWAEDNKIIKIKNHLDRVLPKHIESYISSKYTIDITNKENSKGNAIKNLCKIKNISFDDIIVIGDSYNDISMFEITNHSFVIEGADEFVKSKANYVVKSVKDMVKMLIK